MKFIFLLVLLFSTNSLSYIYWLEDGEYATVNAAKIAAGNRGDTIVIAAGTYNWSSSLLLDSSVVLCGTDSSEVELINDIVNTGSGDFLIRINPAVPSDNPLIHVQGIKFNANLEGGCVSISATNNTYEYTNFRVTRCIMKNTLDNGDSYESVRVKGNCFGVIDNCLFVNNRYDFKVYGNDQNSWDRFPGPDNMGSENFIYIEDNVSVDANYFILTSGEGGRWVYRYNDADVNSTEGNMDAHGNTLNDGVVGCELYENVYHGTRRLIDFRGGVGVIFNNYFDSYYESGNGRIQIREEDCYVGYNCTQYPSTDPVNNSYLWNNRIVNKGIPVSVYEFDSTDSDGVVGNLIEQNRDYWSDVFRSSDRGYDEAVPTVFDTGVIANRPATPADDQCYYATDTKTLYRSVGANNWTQVYQPYTYPHPKNNGAVVLPTGPTLRKNHAYGSVFTITDDCDECRSKRKGFFFMLNQSGDTLDKSVKSLDTICADGQTTMTYFKTGR